MITWDAWQRRYGGDSTVVGRPLGGGPGGPILIGVLPRDFRPLEAFSSTGEAPDFYYAGRADAAPEEEGWEPVHVLGRLGPSVTVDQARAEVQRLAAELTAESPQRVGSRLPLGVRIGLNGLQAQTVGTSGPELGLFMGAAGLLLLLAALNAAMLLFARSLDRTGELEVRRALGAGRTRVVRLLMTEAALISLVGGALGILLAHAGVGAFLRYAPSSLPRMHEVAIDVGVLAAATVLSLATGLAVGLLPALLVSRGTRENARGGPSARSREASSCAARSSAPRWQSLSS